MTGTLTCGKRADIARLLETRYAVNFSYLSRIFFFCFFVFTGLFLRAIYSLLYVGWVDPKGSKDTFLEAQPHVHNSSLTAYIFRRDY